MNELDLKNILANKYDDFGTVVNSIYEQKLKIKLKNRQVVATHNAIRHIIDGHPDVYMRYRGNVNDIINNPDIIFCTYPCKYTKNPRVQIAKTVDMNVIIILEFSLNVGKENRVITMYRTTKNELDKMKLKKEVLYMNKKNIV